VYTDPCLLKGHGALTPLRTIRSDPVAEQLLDFVSIQTLELPIPVTISLRYMRSDGCDQGSPPRSTVFGHTCVTGMTSIVR
jgi:hypothetical protein